MPRTVISAQVCALNLNHFEPDNWFSLRCRVASLHHCAGRAWVASQAMALPRAALAALLLLLSAAALAVAAARPRRQTFLRAATAPLPRAALDAMARQAPMVRARAALS